MVSSTTGTSSTDPSSSSSPANPGSTLSKNAFLQLLVTELQNQDPLQPTDTSAFMQEMTEFSTVEQLTNLNSTETSMQSQGQLSQAVALLGHTITWVDSSGNTQSGVASAVTVAQDGTVQLTVGNSTISPTDVRGVS